MLRDLASLARLPNLPTVWSNVATGYFLALALAGPALAGTTVVPQFQASKLAWLLVSATLLYLHGTFLNDAMDADFDRQHRSERPIPGGRLSRDLVLNLSFAFGLGGLMAAIPTGRFTLSVAALLVVFILLYTWLHKAHPSAIAFMALCRGLLIVMGAVGAVTWWGEDLWPVARWLGGAAVLVLGYTLGISLAARGESTGGTGKWAMAWSRLLLSLPFFLPVGMLLWLLLNDPEAHGWQAGALAGLVGTLGLSWIWFAVAGAKISISTMVGRSLPGLALVDLVLLAPAWLAEPILAAIPMSAFALALVLRRVAPAT